MMQSKSSRFNPVKQLAEDRAKTATEAMVSARNELQGHRDKLSDLMQYRNDYQEQFQSKARSGMNAGQLQQYQQFISQLDKAIEQQQFQVQQSKATLEQKQSHWQDKNSHKKAINKAVDKLKQQEQHKENKREQHELDEHNIQAHIRKP